MVICLERGADLDMAQLMPLPVTVSCSSRIQTGFTFPVPAHAGGPGQRAVERVWSCTSVLASVQMTRCAPVSTVMPFGHPSWSPPANSSRLEPSMSARSTLDRPTLRPQSVQNIHLTRAQLGTVYLTLYEALKPVTLFKNYLNPFYFHSQLQQVIPLPCINLCNAPW